MGLVDDVLIFAFRMLALAGAAVLFCVIASRMRQASPERNVTRARRALLSLWWAISFVSVYAIALRLWPTFFFNLNGPFEIGPVLTSFFNALAIGLSCWAFLPWNRNRDP